jgi:hypothetical protein
MAGSATAMTVVDATASTWAAVTANRTLPGRAGTAAGVDGTRGG